MAEEEDIYLDIDGNPLIENKYYIQLDDNNNQININKDIDNTIRKRTQDVLSSLIDWLQWFRMRL